MNMHRWMLRAMCLHRLGRVKIRGMVFATIVLWFLAHPALAETADRLESSNAIDHSCIGLLWCTDQSAQSRSVDGLLWLYSSEERGSYSRLAIRPFYSMEEDPNRNFRRRSFLWPLGTYEQQDNSTWVQIIPLYWHSERPGHEWTLTAPLYFASREGNVSWQHLFPLISRERIGTYYTSHYILGPVFISTSDTRRNLLEWDFLYPLVHHHSDPESSATRVAPIYWSGEDQAHRESYLYVLPFYGSSDDSTGKSQFLFPLYGRTDDFRGKISRFTMLGLPPTKGWSEFPTLSLFEQVASANTESQRLFPFYRYASEANTSRELEVLLLYLHRSATDGMRDRLFPLYQYTYDRKRQLQVFDVFGSDDTSWFRYEATPGWSRHQLLGLYGYESGQDDSFQLSALGYRALSLYFHQQDKRFTKDRLIPLHEYSRSGSSTTLSMFGLSDLSLYRQESSPARFQHRLFPFYRYRHDLIQDETEFDAALFYRHLTSPTTNSDRLLPFWDYADTTTASSWRLSLLGMDDLALYHHDRDETRTKDHLFPLYGYRSDAEGHMRVSAIGLPPIGRSTAWSLYEHATSPTTVTDRFLPLYRYTEDRKHDETTFDAALLYRHVASPIEVTDRLFPLWEYTDAKTVSSWQLSLLGVDSLALYHHDRNETRTKDHLFPLYGYRIERDGHTQISAIGFPSLGQSPALSLYEHTASPTAVTDRFFPLYSYQVNSTTDSRSLSAFLLFRQTSSPTMHRTSLMPLANLSSNDETNEHSWSLLSLEPALPISWIRHTKNPHRTHGHFFPIYDYQYDESSQALSVGGVSQSALYRQEDSPTAFSRRLFPLFGHSHDRVQGISHTNILMTYGHEQAPGYTIDTLVPLWRYARHDAQQEQRFNALGIGSMSLYEHYKGPSTTSDRLFPLYHYSSNLETGHAEFSVLWPLAQVRRQQGRLTSASLLWWLIAYDRPDESSSNFHVLGGSKMAILRHVVSSETSTFEFNPILPCFRYRSETGRGNSWDLFHGLVGTDSIGEKTRVKLFWMTLG